MARPETPAQRRKKLGRLLLKRWLALSKRLTDDMGSRIEAIQDGEFEAAQAKSATVHGLQSQERDAA